MAVSTKELLNNKTLIIGLSDKGSVYYHGLLESQEHQLIETELSRLQSVHHGVSFFGYKIKDYELVE